MSSIQFSRDGNDKEGPTPEWNYNLFLNVEHDNFNKDKLTKIWERLNNFQAELEEILK